MRVWVSVIAVVLIALAAIAWRFRSGNRTSEPPIAWPTGFSGPARDDAQALTTPTRLTGRVTDAEGAPLPTAMVTLYARAFAFDDAECSECGVPVWSCIAPQTVRKVADALSTGAFPTPAVISEQHVNPDGTFELENVPPGALVLASADGKRSAFGTATPEVQVFQLAALSDVEFELRGDRDEPRTDATATLFEPVLGTTRKFTADRAGKMRVRTADPLAWLFIEAPGALPWGEHVLRDRTVHLGEPRVLVVKTVRDGAPVDADVEVEASRHHLRQRSVKGMARFEGLASAPANIVASAGALVSGSHHVMLAERETEVVVELFEAGTLTLSLEAPDGEPVGEGFVSLSSVIYDANQDLKPGALVTFEHVPAGDFQLGIEAPGFVHEERQLEIAGGRETRLEITLNRPLLVSGTVIDAQGRPVTQLNLSITDENGEDVDTRTRAFGEKFEEEVPHEGKFIVHASSPLLGEGEAPAVAPGPPVVVQLKPKGVLEVRVRSPDGDDLNSSVSVLQAETWRHTYLETPPDGGWARNASLATGDYELVGEPLNYLAFKRTVHVTEGKTTRFELTADPGASLSGRIVADDGAPLPDVRISTGEKNGYVGGIAGEDGTFELRGIAPGPVELATCDSGDRPAKYFQVEAPARGLELKCPPKQLSRGRVVNEKGEPVARFQANSRTVSAADGRFEIPWTGRLFLFADGYLTLSLDDAGVELGDLTLASEPALEGDVVNSEGAPMVGASVRRGRLMDGVRTDSRGHFKLPVYATDELEIMASLGKLSGTARGTVGQRVHIVIKQGVRVTGHIADRQGKGLTATISAEGTGGTVEFRSDAQGNFTGELAEGVWIFNSRLLDGMRAVDIKGPETHVELGRSAGSCGLTVEAPGQLLFVGWLLPSKPASLDAEPEPVANAVSASARNNTLTFSGVPCGAYSVVVSFNRNPGARGLDRLDSLKPSYASELMTLRGENERLVLPAP